ncbi:GNAT family N-acetyltransferase [Methylomonas rosea]|uniref:GNAT family N-acetyltransferase n=1 Tax=Methylomonas rosea TaxID=2952227 RepID=A0ABT1TXR8_9GAMM|nr:GNAT family N-acetyltransferase [Methylomonas sp. WSC-7]MCQ8118863.1 GNAT family N-acetyltransferase [Methylomonas sp. WSC-7]
MKLEFIQATPDHGEIIGSLVVQLTQEICERTHAQHFDIDLEGTVQRCEELLSAGHYAAIIGRSDKRPVAVATIAETYALYAGGKIGVIQEFYVIPEFRCSGVGALLIEQVRHYGQQRGWSCMELCTPPLPEFERTLSFYQQNGLIPVGGRKMRQNLTTNS